MHRDLMPSLAQFALQAAGDLLGHCRIGTGHFLLWKVLRSSSQSENLFSAHRRR